MTRDELNALADRVGTATAKQQCDMLLRAYEAIFGGPECSPVDKWPGYLSPRWDRFHAMLDAEAYESAAMTLVPKSFWLERLGECGGGRFRAEIIERTSDPEYGWCESAATAALALTAASLRAIAQKEKD